MGPIMSIALHATSKDLADELTAGFGRPCHNDNRQVNTRLESTD